MTIIATEIKRNTVAIAALHDKFRMGNSNMGGHGAEGLGVADLDGPDVGNRSILVVINLEMNFTKIRVIQAG